MKLNIRPKNIFLVALGSAVLAFGLYNIHSISGVTEGGVLGLTLLLDFHFDISPSVSGFILNMLCYALGVKTLGKEFIAYSALSSVVFSAVYSVCENFPPLFPQIAEHPFIASAVGGLFVGLGAGLSVRAGGATGGDDALSMSLAKITGKDIQKIYLISDLIVLALSLTYIPISKIVFSLLTVVISGQLIGFVSTVGTDEKKAEKERI